MAGTFPVEPRCTPEGILTDFPCLNCLSETQLLKMLLVLMARGTGFPWPEYRGMVLEMTACNTNLSKRQMLITIVDAMLYADVNGYEDTLKNALQLEGISPAQLLAGITQLICRYFKENT